MHLGINNPCHKFKMIENGSVVTFNSTEYEKDLGVHVDTELNFQCKANSLLDLAK